MRNVVRVLAAIAVTGVLAVLGGGLVLAQQAGSADDVSLQVPFRSVEVDSLPDDVDIDLILTNHSDQRRIVRFEFDGVPAGWDVQAWQRFFNFRINGVAIEPFDGTEESNTQTPRLRVTPPEGASKGSYSFTMRVVSADGSILYDTAEFEITLPESTPAQEGRVELESTFPVLRGPARNQYVFEIAIKNRTGSDQSFDLSAEPPQDWTVQFHPAFGDADRLISSVAPVDNATQRVNTVIAPSRFAEVGLYNVPVTVSNADYANTITFTVEITGQGELNISTVDGRLNAEATAGAQSRVDLVLSNLGTDEVGSLSFFGNAPDGWTVQFDMNEVSGVGVGETLPLYAFITPSSEAIPGDYAVSIVANGPRDFDQVDLRVTVTQSTIWGWLGIVLVIVILGGLVGLFVKLGRR